MCPMSPPFPPAPAATVWTALITPMNDVGEIAWSAFDRLLADQEAAGISGVVIAGTTGESPTLTPTEKLAMIRRARARLGGKVRVMAGTGDNNTHQTVELSRLAADAGADSLLIVTPPYNKPSTEGLIRHYGAIAEAVAIPLCLYHVPGRTAQTLSVDQLSAITSRVPIAMVKEASGDVAYFSRARCRSGVIFLSGDDPTYLASLAVGGSGLISVVSNVLPKAMVEMTKAYFAGDWQRAQALHDALLPAIDSLFCETNPGPTKAALADLGIGTNRLRLPLAEVSAAHHQLIAETLRAARERLAPLVN